MKNNSTDTLCPQKCYIRSQVVLYSYVQPIYFNFLKNLLFCKISFQCLSTYTKDQLVKLKGPDEYFKSSGPQLTYRESCHLQTCFHWPLIKMRSLVEFTFHLSIRKIRQPDFPKPCPEHLVTMTANRSSLTIQHL